MDFHTVTVVVPRSDFSRKDLSSNSLTDATAKVYTEALAKKEFPGGVRLAKGKFRVTFDDMVTQGSVLEVCHTAAIMTLEVTEVAGLSILVLNGRMPTIEQRYCCNYQKRMATPTWQLPMPALEIDKRPLIYLVLFRLGGPDGQDWYDLAEKLIQRANGLGVAVFRLLNTKQEGKR